MLMLWQFTERLLSSSTNNLPHSPSYLWCIFLWEMVHLPHPHLNWFQGLYQQYTLMELSAHVV